MITYRVFFFTVLTHDYEAHPCPEVRNLDQEQGESRALYTEPDFWAILHTYVSRGLIAGDTVLTQLMNRGQTQRREL
jgi:hypothetical protein